VVKVVHLWQRYALQLACALDLLAELIVLLERMQARLKQFARKNKRQTNLSTLQQLKLQPLPC
jgi:hypothetical protein